MKKYLLLSLALMMSLTIMADGKETIDAAQLTKITFNGDQVVLHFSDNTVRNIEDMETITIDMSKTTGINERLIATTKAGIEGKAVYNMKGQLVGKSAANLSKGIYIIGGKKVIIK
jgi:hypothetical protein